MEEKEKKSLGIGKSNESLEKLPLEKLSAKISELTELVKLGQRVDLVTKLAMWSLLVSVIGIVIASIFSIINLNSDRNNLDHSFNRIYYHRDIDKILCF